MQTSEESGIDVHKLDIANAFQRVVSRELGWARYAEPSLFRLLTIRVLFTLYEKPLTTEELESRFSEQKDAISNVLRGESGFGTIENAHGKYVLTKKGIDLVKFRQQSLL